MKPILPLPDDILRRIAADYPEEATRHQVQLTLETLDVPEQHRVARCVLFAADRDFAQFLHMADLAKTDYRDAILCGEYEYEAGSARRVRNFTLPLEG